MQATAPQLRRNISSPVVAAVAVSVQTPELRTLD